MEKDEWIGQVGRALVRSSGMFINEDNAQKDEDDIDDFSDDDNEEIDINDTS